MKQNVLFVGSVPMSLTELHLAPAMIASAVRNRGHNFSYIDANLELWNHCKHNSDQYYNAVGFLQNLHNHNVLNNTVDSWLANILNQAQDQDIILINVFSVLSQGAAYRLIRALRRVSTAKILVGGIGSHKKIFGSINEFNLGWISNQFNNINNLEFGALLLNNHAIDDWQSDVGHDILERHLPQRISHTSSLVDFSDYNLDQYNWPWQRRQLPMLGSHGCVRQCSFCDVVVHFQKYEYIEADALTKQIIDVYEKTQISTIQFVDSLVNGSMSNFLSLCKNLSQSRKQNLLPDNFRWSGTYICRPKSSQLDQIHTYLGSSGAENLIIGVETGSDRIRFEMDKKFTNQDLLYELEAFHRQQVKAQLLFFPSWPTETVSDFDHTLKLFQDLSVWARRGTIDSISLGNSGFVLLDNTPIDRDRNSIGLEPGPTPFLWHCKDNPKLDFWESMRRRLVMHQYALALGIPLAREADFLRYLRYTIQTDLEAIIDYTKKLDKNFVPKYLEDSLIKTVSHNNIDMTIINSGSKSVTLSILVNEQIYGQYDLVPGTNNICWQFDHYTSQTNICLDFGFDHDYTAHWSRYNSGDYYATNGLYISQFAVDNKDITLSAFNIVFESTLFIDAPIDYSTGINQRVVPGPGRLVAVIPERTSFQEHILRSREPDLFLEIDNLISEIVSIVRDFDLANL